jgi:acyl-CoA synthetase (AMP-forming)/AMP-acid ligase II
MTALNSMISRAAGWYSGTTAVVDGERALSFRDVEKRSNRLAHALITLGHQPGGRIAMLMPNRLEAVEVDFAIIKSGGVKIPINIRLRDEERAFLLADSGAETLIFDGEEEGSVESIRAQLSDLRTLIRIGPGSLGRSYEDVLTSGVESLPSVVLDPHAPSMFLYTSGTTGHPKGAVWTNASRMAGTINMLANEIDPHPGDAMAHVGSMAHGSGSKILAHFFRGSRNIPVRQWDPAQFLGLIEEHRVTHTFLVPTMIDQLTRTAPAANSDWSSIKTITYGGAPMAPSRLSVALEVFNGRLVQVYGSCEAPHPVLVLNAADHARGGDILSSTGREVVGMETRLVDATGNDAAPGEPGELVIRGSNVMAGYWNRPEETAKVFLGEWYRTGDIARRDEGG